MLDQSVQASPAAHRQSGTTRYATCTERVEERRQEQGMATTATGNKRKLARLCGPKSWSWFVWARKRLTLSQNGAGDEVDNERLAMLLWSCPLAGQRSSDCAKKKSAGAVLKNLGA